MTIKLEDNPITQALVTACEEYEAATTKPSINALAKQHGLHPQVLRGGLMAYRLVGDPSARPTRRGVKTPRVTPSNPATALGHE